MAENTPISPSPARLGLAVPNYPSSQKITERTAPFFALPPYRRAQLLLQEMAGLTTRLFEVSRNNAEWETAYSGKIPTFLQESCIPPEAASATSIKEVLSILSSRQSLLGEAVTEMLEIQTIEQQKETIAQEIASKDSAMRAFAMKLGDGQRVLEQTLEDYAGYRKSKRQKTSNSTSDDDPVALGEVDVSEILTYARKISYTTFAPPEFGAGQTALRGALPPAPQDEQMRASELFRFADLDVGIPKQAFTEPLPVAIVEPAPEKVIVNPKPKMPVELPGFPPGWEPSVPAGWKPGDPVSLPSDIDIPANWKLGDSRSLPPGMEFPADRTPGDALPPPKPDYAPAPPMPVAPARPVEVIQVEHVQLDINPGLSDEESSEYSTEENSSEEDASKKDD
eukprot:PITA_11814